MCDRGETQDTLVITFQRDIVLAHFLVRLRPSHQNLHVSWVKLQSCRTILVHSIQLFERAHWEHVRKFTRWPTKMCPLMLIAVTDNSRIARSEARSDGSVGRNIVIDHSISHLIAVDDTQRDSRSTRPSPAHGLLLDRTRAPSSSSPWLLRSRLS